MNFRWTHPITGAGPPTKEDLAYTLWVRHMGDVRSLYTMTKDEESSAIKAYVRDLEQLEAING